jgi:hypothetical protein
MAWTDDLVVMLRVLINDLGEPQKYVDAYLQRVIVCAGVLVRKDIELPYSYSFNVGNVTISPDPVLVGDETTQALLPLKAAGLINEGNYMTAVGQGIRVRDGDSAIDTSVGFAGYRDIIRLGPSAAYERLRWQLQASSASAGGAVVGAYRAPGEYTPDSIAWFYDDLAVRTRTDAYRGTR